MANTGDSVDHPEWKVFSLTYVEYPEGDPLGKILSILSLMPLVIVIASVSVFAVKRDLHTMAYGAGMIANGLVRFCVNFLIFKLFSRLSFCT
jgi:hypothetical protein